MIDPDELRAILEKLARDVEPIYDPAPPVDAALQSVAVVINEAWLRELRDIRERVVNAARAIDGRMREAVEYLDRMQPGGCPTRVRELLTSSRPVP